MSIEMKDFPNREEWLKARKTLGIGASEVATACNVYGTALQLWEERVGIKEPFKGNEATERGQRLEPEVRDRFMLHWGWLFSLQYDAFGMWMNSDYPYQYATLDGILTAKTDAEEINIGNNIINLKKGEKIILEIKNPAPRTLEKYNEWSSIPKGYQYQAVAQMLCSGIHKQILVANITGDYQREKPYEEKVFYSELKDFPEIKDEIIATIPKFWEHVMTKTSIDQSIDAVNMALSVSPTFGTIASNFEDVKIAIRCLAEQYRGLTFTEAQYRDAKTARGELNKTKDQIEEKRKSIKKQWNLPYVEFENQCKELLQIIDEVQKPIDAQLKAFDDAYDAQKIAKIKDYIEGRLATGYKDVEPLFTAYYKQNGDTLHGMAINPKWTNRTAKMQGIEEEVDCNLEKVRKEFAVIYSLQEHMDGDIWNGVYSEYISSGLNLVSAINKKNQLIDARKAYEEIKKTEVKKEVSKPQPQPQPTPAEPEKVPNSMEEKKIYRKCVEFSHTSLEEFGGLINYLKQHGFKCREIKEYK